MQLQRHLVFCFALVAGTGAAEAHSRPLVVKRTKGTVRYVATLAVKQPVAGETVELKVAITRRAHVEGSRTRHEYVPVTDAVLHAHVGHSEKGDEGITLTADSATPGTYVATLQFEHRGSETVRIRSEVPDQKPYAFTFHVHVKKAPAPAPAPTPAPAP